MQNVVMVFASGRSDAIDDNNILILLVINIYECDILVDGVAD